MAEPTNPPDQEHAEPIDPLHEKAVREALERVKAGGPTIDGEAFLAKWRTRLDARWQKRTG